MTRCVGHRGAAGLAPENTLASFEAGIAAGVDAVECDVHQTRDGHLILLHDPDVSRTTDGRGLVSLLDFAALRRLNAAARFRGARFPAQRIPTLDEMLELVAGRCAVQVEVKVPASVPYPGIEPAVIATLRRHNAMASAQIISFDLGTLNRLRALAPEVALGFLGSQRSLPAEYRSFPELLAQRARAHGATFVGLERTVFRPAHLDAARGAGLGLTVWTVNEPAEMTYLVDLGVDGITTDRPDLLRRVLAQRLRTS